MVDGKAEGSQESWQQLWGESLSPSRAPRSLDRQWGQLAVLVLLRWRPGAHSGTVRESLKTAASVGKQLMVNHSGTGKQPEEAKKQKLGTNSTTSALQGPFHPSWQTPQGPSF